MMIIGTFDCGYDWTFFDINHVGHWYDWALPRYAGGVPIPVLGKEWVRYLSNNKKAYRLIEELNPMALGLEKSKPSRLPMNLWRRSRQS